MSASGARERATTDLFEAAVLRALGARLIRVDGAHPGTVHLDVAPITHRRLSGHMAGISSAFAELIRSDADLDETPVDLDALDVALGNTFLGRVGQEHAALKNQVLRRRGERR